MLKNYLAIFFFFLSFSWATAQPTATAQPKSSFKVVGYLNTWAGFPASVSEVDLTKITHLNLAFAQPDAKGDLTRIEGLPDAVKKAHAQKVKVLISVGGADLDGSAPYWKKLTAPAGQESFAAKIADYLLKNDLDGIDVDLEGVIPADNYGGFIRALSLKLRPAGKLVTAAVATWYEEKIPATCLPYFDFVNIMAYDSTGPWKPAHPGQHSTFSMAQRDIGFWNAKGLPKEKIILGLPFYGYGFNPGTTVDEVAYKDIIARYPGVEKKDQAGHTIYYNGITTIREKTKLALRQAGGVMIWQLSSDAKGDKSLLNAVDGVVHEAFPGKIKSGKY